MTNMTPKAPRFERSQLAALLQQAQDHLVEIDAAIDRLDAGIYGVCENCGLSIRRIGSNARPQARTCIGCESSR